MSGNCALSSAMRRFCTNIDEPGVEGFSHQVVMPRPIAAKEGVAAGRTWKERPPEYGQWKNLRIPRSIIPGAHLRYVNGPAIFAFPPPSESVAVLQELRWG